MEILEAREALEDAESEEVVEGIRESNRGWYLLALLPLLSRAHRVTNQREYPLKAREGMTREHD